MSIAVERMKDDLNWSEAEKGLALSAFFWGYAAGQMPSVIIVKHFGAKWIFGYSVLVPSILTLFVPAVARFSFTLTLMLRCTIGLFESMMFPACFEFYPTWIPLSEKTMMISVITSGCYLARYPF